MDFCTTGDAPFPITIDGTAYKIPRFLGPALAAWAAEEREKTRTESTAHLSPQDKARFLMYFQPPPVDVGRQLREASTAEGAEYIVRRQMKAAGVPDDLIEKVIAHDDPAKVTNLAQELTMLPTTVAQVNALAGLKEGETNPLKPPTAASGGVASTGIESVPVSTPSTEASSPTA